MSILKDNLVRENLIKQGLSPNLAKQVKPVVLIILAFALFTSTS